MNREKVFDALRNCITEPKCRDCPWETCEEFHQTKKIPLDLCLDILKMLKEQGAIEPDVDSEGSCSCGNCGTTVRYSPAGCSVPEKLCKYCPECGKRVKWE